ncbi:neuropeptide Y receptor type 6-like [Myxocyprinus asiaticus]|uniref:neuropeptide Y receptor type 6-like n=1 Tax=Myxocyprinus asiaticus TaxID=70543 RepID=UPI002222C98A|nr:neuropeptide Y receptor type 6-like [Myxocyprinus asiaticus]XP_051578077.1 neuropeptide Y receptor type 6-like [Myxocyprinus asiaticus]
MPSALFDMPWWQALLNSTLTRNQSNSSLFLLDAPCWQSGAMTLTLVLCYGLVLILGLLGNILLICIIMHQRDPPNVTSVLIANLSVSDILVCVFCLPFTVVYTLMDHWIFGALLCRLMPFIQCVSVTVSVLSLVLIALERHQLILHPSGWKPSVPQAYVAVLIMWLLACVTSLPFLAFHLLSSEPYILLPPPLSHLQACLEVWPSQQHKLAYTTSLLLFQYCFPLLLMLFCYLRIFLRLQCRQRMLERQCSRNREDEHRRVMHTKRINVMLFTLVAAFTVCWLPLNAFNVVADWHQEVLPVCQHDMLFSVCHLLAMSSTCVNPIIYGFLNSNFRKDVASVVLHCHCRPLEDSYEHFPMSTMNTDISRVSLRLSYRNNSV